MSNRMRKIADFEWDSVEEPAPQVAPLPKRARPVMSPVQSALYGGLTEANGFSLADAQKMYSSVVHSSPATR